jgi:hypothetical protein
LTTQLKVSNVFANFITNKECVLDFLENLKIPNLDLSTLGDFTCRDFRDDKVVRLYNKPGDNEVLGFVVNSDSVEIYIPNPEYDYLKFWNVRNKLTYNLARFYRSDNKAVRYMVNISSKDYLNNLTHFNIYSNFYIWNVYKKDEKLENWLNVLYY